MGANYGRQVAGRLIAVGLMIGGMGVPALAEEPATGMPAGTWASGAAIGYLGNTPDGGAFAININADRFLTENFSLGPLIQLGFTKDLMIHEQLGVSGQGKYWMNLPNTENRGKLNLQAGIGFVRSERSSAGATSFLIPLGIGLDYQLNEKVALTTTFLLNFTDLSVAGNRASLMPSITVGARF